MMLDLSKKILSILLLNIQLIPVYNQETPHISRYRHFNELSSEKYGKEGVPEGPHISKYTPQNKILSNVKDESPTVVSNGCAPLPCYYCKDPVANIKVKLNRVGLKTVNDAFVENSRVTELYLDDNDIMQVSPIAFMLLPNLEILNLSDNNISTGKLLWFTNLDSLKKLIINDNKYRGNDMELERTLQSLQNLQELSLSGNGITRFAVNLKTFAPRLTSLCLSGNNISSVEFFEELPESLTDLRVDNNFISSVDGSTLRVIEKLSIGGNKIERLCGSSCESSNSLALNEAIRLVSLNASRNRINQVEEDTFANTKRLVSLDLSGNNITALPKKVFEGLFTIEELYISQNRLSSVPHVCSLQRVKWLDLSGNNIVAIAREDFCPLPRMYLKTLLLNDNRITSIDSDAFTTMPSLQKLDLSNNFIIDFPASVISVAKALQIFMLKNNSIASLDNLIEARSTSLQELHLQENPLLSVRVASIRFEYLPSLVIHFKEWPLNVEDDKEDGNADKNADSDKENEIGIDSSED